MTNKILLGASVLALLASFPALAAEVGAKANADANVSTGQKIENTLDRAGNKISETADKAAVKTEAAYEDTKAATKEAFDKTKAKSKEAYSDVKTYFGDKDDEKVIASFNAGGRITADELIGTSVQDPAGKDIGKIEDILVDAEGDAETVVINDKGVLGLGGKLAAFDYDVIEGFNKDKDIVVKLNEKSIKAARAFDYDSKDAKVAGIPAGQFSVKKIQDAKVVDANGKAVADVETVAFEDDDADYLIVTFNKILGMGGEKAALNFEALDLVENNGKYSFKLNSQQTAQFESEKEAAKKAN